jgi:hypothetical protein
MRERRDPLLPILASVVSLILVAAAIHLYPYVARHFERGPPVVQVLAPPDEEVAVWVCKSVEGVALLLRAQAEDHGLGGALEGGPHRLMTLYVFNFAREAPFELNLPEAGFLSPEGGEPAVPAAKLVKADVPAQLRPVLLGLGAVRSLRVPKGHRAQALLALRGDPAPRTAFVSGGLTFERRELEHRALARFEQRPDAKQFGDFG